MPLHIRASNTGVSVTTIGRVARFLEQENYKGYQRVLEKTQKGWPLCF